MWPVISHIFFFIKKKFMIPIFIKCLIKVISGRYVNLMYLTISTFIKALLSVVLAKDYCT